MGQQQYPVGPVTQSYSSWPAGRPGLGSHMSPTYPGNQTRGPNAGAVASGGYCPGVGVPSGGQGGGAGYMMPVRPGGYNAQFMPGQGGYVVSSTTNS